MGVRRVAVAVEGTVQGVGYRPFVVELARRLQLAGDVTNVGGGVRIDAQGTPEAIAELLRRLVADAPAAARVTEVRVHDETPRPVAGFVVRPSAEAAGPAFVAPDRGPCAACVAELADRDGRRWGYPFGSCNACGPRWTVVTSAPYARARTTMARFLPCARCREEHEDPGGRHFLAETIACPSCGPRLCWESDDADDRPADALARAVSALRAGAIVAVKGVGGYHLACDAADEGVVTRLRARKGRDAKPFAVLVADRDAAARLADLDATEREVLAGPTRPIVLVRRHAGPSAIAPAVAPGTPWLGILLPPSLLHLLLARAFGGALVLTSGNRSDEPMPVDASTARARLSGIADGFLHHDRPIVQRVDDSVVRVVRGRPLVLRRARGLAPEAIRLHRPLVEPILAVGGDLKGAFAVGVGDRAVVSHHLGDLGDVDATTDLERCLAHVERLLGVRPRIVAHDLHPDQESTRLALAIAAARGGRAIAVPHHHAHVAACLADAGRDEPIIGVALDGLGLGADGGLWGGEILVGTAGRLARAAHLRPVALPGGDAAARAPWRVAIAHLIDAGLATDRVATHAPPRERALVEALVRAGRAPLASSAGRLFDVVACLAGLRATCSYEGQAAIELEGAAAGSDERGAYPFDIEPGRGGNPTVIDTRSVVRSVAADVDAGLDGGAIAARFHHGLADAITAVASRIRDGGGPATVALGGGVFANAILLAACEDRLSRHGFEVLRPTRVPPNDGGLALGQLAVAAARGGA